MTKRAAKRKLDRLRFQMEEDEADAPAAGSGSEEDEGSSDDEVVNQKDKLMTGGVLRSVPVAKVLAKPGSKAAYAAIVDLGGGVDGFVHVSDFVQDESLRETVSEKLLNIRKLPAPEPGRPDKRVRLHKLLPVDQGRSDTQLRLTGIGAKVCQTMNDDWAAAVTSEPCRELLQFLYDRDRLGELCHSSGVAVGLLLEGVIQHRTNEGLVISLSNPWNTRQRNLVGVAVGANAEVPTGDLPPLSPASVPGTPGSPFSTTEYDVSKIRPGCLKCRVLDFDPATGFVDVACAPSIVQTKTAHSTKATQSIFKTLQKKIGKPVPVQIILKKKTYAVVISKPNSGFIGYLALSGVAGAAALKVGDRITATVEYVRVKPQVQRKPKFLTRKEQGRRMLSEEEKLKEEEAERAKRREQMKVPLDPWLCAEPFAVMSYVQPVAAQPTAGKEAVDAIMAPPPSLAVLDVEKPKPAKQQQKAEGIEAGFSFREETVQEEHSGDDATDEGSKKKKRKKKKAEENELLVDEIERARLAGGAPKTMQDFERLVMGSPHSSYVWCQYMAFHMAHREFEQARVIAEKALKTINYRESEELRNVWVAFLNLENLHGTPESLNSVFQRFVQHSDDPYSAYEALITIAKASNHHVLADKTYQTVLKKFGQQSVKPWVDYASYLLSRGQQDDITKLQKRLLNNHSISDKQHVEALLKIANAQFKIGSIDKGRTIFEGLLVKYPKRTDLWSVYLDIEQSVLPRLDDKTRIRSIFDRVTSMNLSSKKMKQFMTRYMAFEKLHGSPDRVEYVKQRAIDFVNARLGDAEDE